MSDKPVVIIKNDIESTFKFMKSLGDELSHKFDLMMIEVLKDLSKRGHDDIATLLTNNNESVFLMEEATHVLDHELYYFHIYIKGPDGEPKVDKFLVIDKTDNEVYDNSENIVTRH